MTSSTPRLQSLDAFRGATVMAMLLVNNPGTWAHMYGPLKHAAWHGCTPTDLIFPFFLFIMGVAIPMALGRAKREGQLGGETLRKVLFRSLRLVVAGLFLAAFPFYNWNSDDWLQLSQLRLPGVLQRIGLVYFAASLLYLHLSERKLVVLSVVVLLGYWALETLVPVPGLGRASLEKGHDLSAWLDQLVLGSHMWKETYDPEGLLSTLPALVSALLGVLVGEHLKRRRAEPHRLLSELMVAGVGLAVVGLAWGQVFPLNKALWTSSFVCYTAGLGCLGLGVFFWLLDVRQWRWWGGLPVAFGRNAITAFLLSGLVARLLSLTRVGGNSLKGWVYHWVETPFQPELGSLLYSLVFLLPFCGLMWWMYKRNIIVKI